MIILILLVVALGVALINRKNLFGSSDTYHYAPQPDVDADR